MWLNSLRGRGWRDPKSYDCTQTLVLYVLLSLYGGGISVTQHNSDSFEFLCVDTHLVSKQNSLSSLVQYSWMETGMEEAVEWIIWKKTIVNIVFAQQSRSIVQNSWMETGMGEAVGWILWKEAINNIVFTQQLLTASYLLLPPFRFFSLSVARHTDERLEQIEQRRYVSLWESLCASFKLFFYGKGLKPMLRRRSGDLGGTKNQQVRKNELTPI